MSIFNDSYIFPRHVKFCKDASYGERLTCPMLSIDESAAQPDRLIADMAQLRSSDEAADWVCKNMPLKNELTAADADLVERPSAIDSR